MQEAGSHWYFVLGAPEKSSLASQYSRENNFAHLAHPNSADLDKNQHMDTLIEGPLQLFR